MNAPATAACPICRHALDGHSPSCAESACACIYDPKGSRIVPSERRPLAFGSFDTGARGTERQRVTLRAPSYFKPKRGIGGLVVGLILALFAASVLVWKLKG